MTVVISGESEKIFLTTAKKAAAACLRERANEENFSRWLEDFKRFLIHIHQWCREHQEDVSRCYLDSGPEGMQIFIETRGEQIHYSLQDKLGELDLALRHEFDWCAAASLQLPETPQDEVISFLEPDRALQVF